MLKQVKASLFAIFPFLIKNQNEFDSILTFDDDMHSNIFKLAPDS